jgi:hypothetical protein
MSSTEHSDPRHHPQQRLAPWRCAPPQQWNLISHAAEEHGYRMQGKRMAQVQVYEQRLEEEYPLPL